MKQTEKAQHTPGPWRADRCCVIVEDAPWIFVATVTGSETDAQNYTNARLIAAAPDLLAALNDLANAVEDASIHGYDAEHRRRLTLSRRAAWDAIAKAEGGGNPS